MRTLLVCVAILASARPLFAQQGFSELRGRVVDAQAAVLPGVPIVARHQESGIYRETVSGGDGSFFFSAMTPGVYEVTAELSGFKRYHVRDIRLEVGKQTAIEVTLAVGTVTESVTVTAEAPLIDTSSKEIGGFVNAQELADTPAFNRNFTAYLGLMPGVVASISNDSFGADSINVNGQAVQNVNYTFDGSNNNDTFNGGNGGAQARIPVEAVQEFQLLTGQFDAEHGAASGAVVNAVSKQGTNAWRGSAFFFYQDDSMTTRDFFARQNDLEKPETRQHQWGGTFGGPIVRDKAHFFWSVERILQDAGITVNIPARPEFNTTTFEQTRVWNYMLRFDHQIKPTQTWGLRYLFETSPQANQMSTTWTPERNEQETDQDWTLVATLSSVLGHNIVNTLRISGTQEDVNFGNPGFFENGGRQELLSPSLDYQNFSTGPSDRHSRRLDRAIFADEAFSWFVPGKAGDHDLKLGAQYFWASLLFQASGNLNGTYEFGHNLPFNAADPRTYPERFSIRVPGPLDSYMKGHFISSFMQDRWRLNNRLSLSLGVRYDLEVIPLPGSSQNPFVNTTGHPVDKNNFSPRLGFSYAMDDASRSVLRGGFGVFYQRTPYTYIDEIIFAGEFADSFTATFPRFGRDSGPSQGRFPTDPFLVNGPGPVNRNLLNAMFPAGTLQRNAGTVNFDNANRHLPYARQYSIGYERQVLRNMSIGFDLVRSEQRAMLLRQNLNPPLRRTTARSAALDYPTAGFVNVMQGVNLGDNNYTALQVTVDKRLSDGFSLRGSYAFSRSRGNTTGGTPETIFSQLGDDLRLDQMYGPSGTDRPHILSINGTVDIPRTKGLKISGVMKYQSAQPFSLTNENFDMDRNGSFTNEWLPAGTYSGTGPNAVTVDYDGGRNGARTDGYFRVDLRAGYRIRLAGGRTIDAFLDIFNVTNHTNFGNPAGDTRSPSTVLVRRTTILPVRTAQLNFRYAF